MLRSLCLSLAFLAAWIAAAPDSGIVIGQSEQNYFIDSPDAIPQSSPLVSQSLDKHR